MKTFAKPRLAGTGHSAWWQRLLTHRRRFWRAPRLPRAQTPIYIAPF